MKLISTIKIFHLLLQRCYDYVRVRDSGSQESVKCDDNAIESKKRSKSCNISSHFLENDEEVLDRKSVGEKDDLQSLDRSDSLGTNSSKTESVPDREADSLNSIFVTASSSDVNSASNRRSVGERTISAQKSSTQLKVSSRGTESIAMDLSYGAEVVEVLNLYNIERIYEGGIKKDTS